MPFKREPWNFVFKLGFRGDKFGDSQIILAVFFVIDVGQKETTKNLCTCFDTNHR